MKKLLNARKRRVLPVDDKLLAAWNGLALSALASAASLKDANRYKTAAGRIRDYLVRELWDGESLLRARSKQGKPIGNTTVEDYAYVARGLLDWARVSGKQEDFAIASMMVRQAWQRYFSASGWQLSETSLLAYGGGEAILADGPLPSPSAVLLDLSRELLQRKDDPALREQMLKAVAAGQDLLVEDPYWFASHVEQVMNLQQP